MTIHLTINLQKPHQNFMKLIDEIIQPKQVLGNSDQELSEIQYDSRKCTPGSTFVAIKGYTVNGHDYIDSAINNGASHIVCEIMPSNPNEKITYYMVDNSRIALAQLAQNYYGNPQDELSIIGITGTNGKTTCAYLAKNIIETASHKAALIGTNGIFIGNEKLDATHTTPESLELFKSMRDIVNAGCTWLVMEVSSHSLHQNRVHGINFIGAIFTNLSQDHLDYHGTMQNYFEAKKILFDMLPEKSVAVTNLDDQFGKRITTETKSRVVGYTQNKDLDYGKDQYMIYDLDLTLSGTNFTLVKKPQQEFKINLSSKMLGEFNVRNLSAVFSLMYELGFDENVISKVFSEASGAEGRMHPIDIGEDSIAIIDYAHTPDGLANAVKACNMILKSQGKGELITVFGCGGDRDKGKRPQMGHIAVSESNYSIVTSDNPRTEDPNDIINDILTGISSSNFEVIEDREKAIIRALSLAKKGDIVLIAGKGHEKYQVIGTEKIYFSDFDIVFSNIKSN